MAKKSSKKKKSSGRLLRVSLLLLTILVQVLFPIIISTRVFHDTLRFLENLSIEYSRWHNFWWFFAQDFGYVFAGINAAYLTWQGLKHGFKALPPTNKKYQIWLYAGYASLAGSWTYLVFDPLYASGFTMHSP